MQKLHKRKVKKDYDQTQQRRDCKLKLKTIFEYRTGREKVSEEETYKITHYPIKYLSKFCYQIGCSTAKR